MTVFDMSRLLAIILLGVSSAQFNSNPAVSESNGAATLSWQIPTGGLGSGSTFYTISPTGSTAFFLTSTGVFLALGNYTGRVEFSGSYTSRNITFTLRNISSADARSYRCGNGAADDVISDCGQMLVVLGKPTKPLQPSPSTTPVYAKQVTLTCTSNSTSLPAGHGLTLTYTWERDGTVLSSDPGTSFTFTVTSRDPHNYRCRADESRGLESDWSDVYQMEPEYGPYQETLTPPGLSYSVIENQTTIPPISISANCKPACTYRWEKNGTNFSNSAVLNLGQSSRSQTGSYRCRAVNGHGSVYTSSVIVNVHYAPEVHITTPAGCRPYRVFVGQQNVQLVCEVTASNPEVMSFTWSHNNSVASSTSGRVLTLNTTSERSSGSYSCQGNNGISGSSVSQSLTLDVQYGPRVSIPAVSPVVEGQNLTVRCTVDANPTASVSWTKKTDSSFTRTGSVLQFTGIQRDEAGEYVCSASNTISPCGQKAFRQSGEEEVTVDVQCPPDAPSDLSVTSDGSSVYVTWLRGYNGRYRQTFTVEYSLDKTLWKAGSTEAEVVDLEYYKTAIFNLEPLTQYFVRVRAHNKHGDSPFTEIVSVTTGVRNTEPYRTDSHGTGIGIGIGICLPVIAALVVVLVLMYRRRTTTGKRESVKTDQSQTDRAYEDVGPASLVDRSTYDGLDNMTRIQDYAELKLYENTKK